MPEADERALIEAARKDPARFGDLYELHFHRIYAFIARRVGDRTEAEDLTSEVFQNALAKLANYEWRAPFSAWLYRIAANAVADHFQRRTRSPVEAELAGNAEQPDIEQAEHLARLYRLVERLPANQRRVIEMRFTEEKNTREIAAVLKLSEGAVKQLQFRGLQSLRGWMEEANG